MTKQQKIIAAAVAGGLILLYLLYRYESSAGSTAGTGTVAPDSSAAGDQFASLAGQEQSDVAALQGQNTTLSAQEAQDVAGLTSGLAGLTTQEQSDVSGLAGSEGLDFTNLAGQEASDVGGINTTLTGLGDAIKGLTTGQATLGTEIAALGSGVKAINRVQTATVQAKRGTPFFKYYVKVTGKAPPKRVAASNFVYEAYKSGINATVLGGKATHPAAKNTHVAHPNPSHAARPTVKPPAKPPAIKPLHVPTSKPKPPAAKPPAKKAPPKAKPSGARR